MIFCRHVIISIWRSKRIILLCKSGGFWWFAVQDISIEHRCDDWSWKRSRPVDPVICPIPVVKCWTERASWVHWASGVRALQINSEIFNWKNLWRKYLRLQELNKWQPNRISAAPNLLKNYLFRIFMISQNITLPWCLSFRGSMTPQKTRIRIVDIMYSTTNPSEAETVGNETQNLLSLKNSLGVTALSNA